MAAPSSHPQASVGALWLTTEPAPPDTHAAFRGRFDLPSPAPVTFRLVGASWYVLWIDGQLFCDGPSRFHPDLAEYEVRSVSLPAGPHLIAAHVHHVGQDTRLLRHRPPFFFCQAAAGGQDLPVAWRAVELQGYTACVRRTNPELPWIEWCDTRRLPTGWLDPAFDDSAWPIPVAVPAPATGPTLGPPPRLVDHPLSRGPTGQLAERFAYERDEPAARFLLRDLAPRQLPPQGLWCRYDLGRVRLGRLCLTLDLPAGSVVEIAASEHLIDGRVSPFITLSAGPSCNLDHFVARGGVQQFLPIHPRGGRFVEVHLLADPQAVRFVAEHYLERAGLPEPQGQFHCSDPLLNRIWKMGIDTLQACAEDTLVDNPTRERGLWCGDVTSVGLEVMAAGYADLSLLRRCLVLLARCAADNGLVAGLCPGQGATVSTYAAQWVTACWRYFQHTGDRSLLEDLYSAARRNMEAFVAHTTPAGVASTLGWAFVDWGAVAETGPGHLSLTMLCLEASRAMENWCRTLGHDPDAQTYAAYSRRLSAILCQWLASAESLDEVGYHRLIHALRLGLLTGPSARAAATAARRHILSCFPNQPSATRLTDPGVHRHDLITPYFAHFALPALLPYLGMDFLLDQYRIGWGWMLDQGITTTTEVFDVRWSHCHQWSACPTWQLTRYVLGLTPRFDLAPRHFALALFSGSLQHASGTIPVGGAPLHVQWQRTPQDIQFACWSEQPFTLIGDPPESARRVERSLPLPPPLPSAS